MNASFDERMMSQNNSTNNRRSSLDEDKISISSLNSNKRFKNSITDKIKQREMLSEMAAGNGPILSEKDKCQQKMEEKEFTMNHGFNNILSQKIKYKSIVQENISSNQSKYIKNEKPDHNSYYKNYVENPNSSSMLEKIGAKTNINKKKYYNALQEQSNKNQEMKEKEKIVDKNNSLRSVLDNKKYYDIKEIKKQENQKKIKEEFIETNKKLSDEKQKQRILERKSEIINDIQNINNINQEIEKEREEARIMKDEQKIYYKSALDRQMNYKGRSYSQVPVDCDKKQKKKNKKVTSIIYKHCFLELSNYLLN